ncbi:DUF2690 domain-containing protein [Streptomyces sp. PU-14G]|uniref:helix-turn-helix domain-containing protein n=1 Tax=Streptomyces sp. PU-14G TaxID=2800808 RepID=UPI0034E00410
MPRWRSLPEDLDPQIREFANQLRRLVDRSGLSIAGIADRTGYSKSSWERYLSGRLLPPRGATQALAEVTGTDVRHLGTMWELAERAWSRSEMRHDTTLEAIQIAQARAALNGTETTGAGAEASGPEASGPGASGPEAPGPEASGPETGVGQKGRRRRKGERPGGERPGSQLSGSQLSGSQLSGSGPSAGSDPFASEAVRGEPPQDQETAVLRKDAIRAAGATGPGTREHQVPGQRSGGSDGQAAGFGATGPGVAGSVANRPEVRGPDGTGPRASGTGGAGGERPGRGGRRKVTVLLAALVGVLVLVAGAVLFLDLGGGVDEEAKPKPSPTEKTRKLPAGVKCAGEDCSGEDPEAMGCGGAHAATVSSARVGSGLVEVRYSDVCKAAWGRISGAAADDVLRITGPGGQKESDTVAANDAYTAMVSAPTADDARACATTAAGGEGCTTPGRTVP